MNHLFFPLRLLAIKEELEETWKFSYYEESTQSKTKMLENLIEKLLNQNLVFCNRVFPLSAHISLY